MFLLHTWAGGKEYEYFDEMDVDDNEWEQSVYLFLFSVLLFLPVVAVEEIRTLKRPKGAEIRLKGHLNWWNRMKESNEQFDDRIVEVCWNTEVQAWKLMRIRDDKPNANHKTIMQKIIVSIEDGVEIEAVGVP